MGSEVDPEWKSIDIVRKELDSERELQAKIADTADARAGVVLGFSGAVAALAANSKVLFAVPGALLAVIAAVTAASALLPRAKSAIDPMYLTTNFAAAEEEKTKKEVLKRHLANYEKNKDIPGYKLKRLKLAIGMCFRV